MFADFQIMLICVIGVIGFALGVGFGASLQRCRVRKLEQKCNYDHLTGLRKSHDLEIQVLQRLNKKEKRVNGLSATRSPKRSGAVVFLDVDGFKKANDSLGHEAGNKILQILAKIIKSNLRDDNDFAVRYSSSTAGDEFVLLFIGTTMEDAGRAMMGIRRRFEEATAFAFPSLEGQVSFSFGMEKVCVSNNTVSIGGAVTTAEQRAQRDKQERKMER